MKHQEPQFEWVRGRLVKAPCLCPGCESRRLWTALGILLVAGGTAAGLVILACKAL